MSFNPRGLILPSRIVGVLIVLLSLPLLGVAVWWGMGTREFVRTAAAVNGRVVEVNETRDMDGGVMYTPTFEVVDGSGTPRRVVSSWSSNPPGYVVGDGVAMLQDPANPGDVRVDSFWSLWLGPMIFGALGVFQLCFALVFLWLVPLAIRGTWREAEPEPEPEYPFEVEPAAREEWR